MGYLPLLVQAPIQVGVVQKAPYLQLVLLHCDFTVDSVSLITTHFLQLFSVEGEELSSSKDAKVFHCPGKTQSQEIIIVLHVASCQR